ncbi:MAG: hypothetical protein A3F54_00405 [Candidatus Kerfeldbacteria bacterium RIFCSPHIGHO2_12_FULL_48_17]|uniref:O-antigen ligase-related domain-containing protein n=1 Tax=Candidatus Kerfeldbacteria bacterium RIFCSPHIGHO2_12_FULL_48_17 TaxID=1798542 RepID=A0A1G2B5Z1_9BACT|nr:MAG: hypothetical protein A3F54_00405 [Candidatus Kerfeldbacteria bacterium RIFCSPHIGHO2_12_FULL_48_17]
MKKISLPILLPWLVGGVLALVALMGMYYLQPLLVFLAFVAMVCVLIVWNNPMLGIYFVVFFLPFERIGSYEFAGITVRFSQLFTVITLGVWLMRGLIAKKLFFHKNPLFWPMIVFIAINIVSLVSAVNVGRSVMVLAFTIFTMLITFLLPNFVTSRDIVVRVAKILFACTLIVTLFGIYQFIGDLLGLPHTVTGLRSLYTKSVLGFPRVQSTALEPLYFANFLLLPAGWLYALFLKRNNAFRMRRVLPLLVLCGVNLVLTVSRGGYLAFAGMIVALTLFYLRHFFHPKRIVAMVSIFVVVTFVSLQFFSFDNATEKFTEHTAGVFQGASFEERTNTISIAWQVYKNHPFFGIGVGSFGPAAAKHPYLEPEAGWYIVNNEFLELLAEVGVVGFLAFLVIVGVLLVRSWQAWRRVRDPFLEASLVGLMGAFFGILIQYQTFSILYIMHVWFLIGLIISVQNIILEEKHH